MEGRKISVSDQYYDEFDEVFDGKKLENGPYWTNGKKVFFEYHEIYGADKDTLIQYDTWATDKKHCYYCNERLTDADRETFIVLNYIFAKDKYNVWESGKKVKGVDAETFEVFHNKQSDIGFCKDKNHVYHFFIAELKIVKKASPRTFVSLDDGEYGFDEKSVYIGTKMLPKANPKTWRKIREDSSYSKDKYIYFLNHIIKKADLETFEVVVSEKELKYGLSKRIECGKDKNNFYYLDKIITKKEFERLVK